MGKRTRIVLYALSLVTMLAMVTLIIFSHGRQSGAPAKDALSETDISSTEEPVQIPEAEEAEETEAADGQNGIQNDTEQEETDKQAEAGNTEGDGSTTLIFAGDVLFANASDEQIIEWGKQYVVHSIEDSLKEGESYKIMEWILAEKKTSIPVEVWQMDNTYKKDSISGCVKLLDTRGIFDELAFIGNGDSAFVAFAVAYTIDEKNGNSSFLEKVFTLDKSGKVLDCSDYLSPSQKRKQIEENFNRALEQMGPILIQTVKEGAAMAGKDTSNVTSITINGKTYSE